MDGASVKKLNSDVHELELRARLLRMILQNEGLRRALLQARVGFIVLGG